MKLIKINEVNKKNKVLNVGFLGSSILSFSLLLFPLISFAQAGGSVTVPNPIAVGTIPEFLSALFRIVAEIGAVVLAFYIIYTGFLFVSAQGNESALQKAKESLKWVLIGGAIILGAWVLSEAVRETIVNLS